MTKRFCDDCKRELPVKTTPFDPYLKSSSGEGSIYYHVFIDRIYSCEDHENDSDEVEYEFCPACLKKHNF